MLCQNKKKHTKSIIYNSRSQIKAIGCVQVQHDVKLLMKNILKWLQLLCPEVTFETICIFTYPQERFALGEKNCLHKVLFTQLLCGITELYAYTFGEFQLIF